MSLTRRDIADQVRSAESRHLTRCTQQAEPGNPVLSPFGGKRVVRQADGGAGMGGRKKRRPSCNGVDRGPMPWHESALTSDWSLVAKRGFDRW